MAVGGGEGPITEPHQRVGNRQEIFADDRQPAFGQQEMDVRHPAVLRILDRDDRPRRQPVLHRVECILEAEAGQWQALAVIFERSPVSVAPRCALERDREARIGGGGAGQFIDQGEGGGGKRVHDRRGAYGAWANPAMALALGLSPD